MSSARPSLYDRLGRLVDKAASAAYRERREGSSTEFTGGLSTLTHDLGLLLMGATPEALRGVVPAAVGYGTRVTVRDLGTGDEADYVLMSGSAMNLDAGHVSIESPRGQSLLGCTKGDVVEVQTPGGPARLQVVEVKTLVDIIEEAEASLGLQSAPLRRMANG